MEKNPVNALPEVPANPFVELGSVVGTLENVSDAIEQVRFTLG